MATRSTVVRLDRARKIITPPSQLFALSLYFHIVVTTTAIIVIIVVVVIVFGGEYRAIVSAVGYPVCDVIFILFFTVPFHLRHTRL